MGSLDAATPLSQPYVPLGHGDVHATTVVTTLVLFWIATLFFLLQLGLTLRKRFFLKTWLAQTALACAWTLGTAQAACLLTAEQLSHAEPPSAMQTQLLIAADFISVSSMAASKAAGVASVMILMAPRGRDLAFSWACVAFSAVYLIVAIVTAIINTAPCESNCGLQTRLQVASASINILSELLIIALPIPVICKISFPDAVKTKRRLAVISGYSTRLLAIALLGCFIASITPSGNQSRLDSASPLWNQSVVFAQLTAACTPMSMSFIKLARSGAMGARMHDTQLQSVVAHSLDNSGAGMSSSKGGFTRKIQNLQSSEGTRSTCRSEPLLLRDEGRLPTGLSHDGIHVLQELTIEPESILRRESSAEDESDHQRVAFSLYPSM